MNEFPKFEAGKPALEQLSASRLNLVSGGQKSNQIQPGIGYRVTQTPGGTTVSAIRRRRGIPGHPWKVLSNGDNTINVSAGRMATHRTNGTGNLNDPISIVGFFLSYAGEEGITVTGDGYVYALSDIGLVIVADDTLPGSIQLISEREVFSGAPTVVFSTTAPDTYDPQDDGRNFAMVLAEVSLTDDIATVEEQFVKDDIWPVGGSYTYEGTP